MVEKLLQKVVRNDEDKNSIGHSLDQPHTMCTGSSPTAAWKSRRVRSFAGVKYSG